MNLYEMAEQCNCWLEDTGNLVTDNINLKAFEDLVRADEREACLQIQEDWQYQYANDLVQKIRARGETK